MDQIKELQEVIGYEFKNEKLLVQALTHSSCANERKINKIENYERLEFLGDAVLELVSSDFLYGKYPDKKEGELTKLRASMVCESALSTVARQIGLQRYLMLGKGEDSTGGRERNSILCDVVEAVIGGIYIDSGMEAASSFIHKFILSDSDKKLQFFDSKSKLQEKVQKSSKGKLHYELIREAGPDHDKVFEVNAMLDDKIIGSGVGKNKKAAEQQAAYEALMNNWK